MAISGCRCIHTLLKGVKQEKAALSLKIREGIS